MFQEGYSLHDLTVFPHRPLGCSIEESLEETNKFVFVEKVNAGSNAAKAGLQEGDVIVQITGLFEDTMEKVATSGIESIKSLVTSCPESKQLKLVVARNTGVMERHNEVIVELCGKTDNEKEVEDCILDFLKSGYSDEPNEDMLENCSSEDENAECMIEDIYNLWAADEQAVSSSLNNNGRSRTGSVKDDRVPPLTGPESNQPKPWSSRASPSGTFVRDPVTGQMRNIDA